MTLCHILPERRGWVNRIFEIYQRFILRKQIIEYRVEKEFCLLIEYWKLPRRLYKHAHTNTHIITHTHTHTHTHIYIYIYVCLYESPKAVNCLRISNLDLSRPTSKYINRLISNRPMKCKRKTHIFCLFTKFYYISEEKEKKTVCVYKQKRTSRRLKIIKESKLTFVYSLWIGKTQSINMYFNDERNLKNFG